MVRFHWPVEGGHSAWVPIGGMKVDEKAGVRHITLDMELAGQNETVMSLLTVPSAYLDASKVRPLGVVLAHGGDAEASWRGPLLEPLACALAAAGHVVMRYYCPLKEQRRHRILEKAADVAATSPYARAVKRWALVGFDNGARIAAGVAVKVAPRTPLAGLALLSYPLLDPQPPPPKQKQGATPPADSVAPLAKLADLRLPLFFLCGEFDRLCPGARLKETIGEVLAGCDSRVVVLEGLSGRFCQPGSKEVEEAVAQRVVGLVQTFLAALQDGSMASCQLPAAAELEPSTRPLPDVPESPKREASPEEEEEEEEEPPPPPRRGGPGRGRGGRGGAAPAAAAARPAAAAAPPQGVVTVLGPHGQPMLVPAGLAGTPVQQQQLLMMQQQFMAAQLHKAQQQHAAGGGGGAPPVTMAQQQMQQMQQMQMAMLQAQMAAAQAAAARPAAGPAAVPAAAQQPAPMAVDPK